MVARDLTQHFTAGLHVRSDLLEMLLVGERGERTSLRDAANAKL